jgi:plasmid maintenance system antidote protein VapI
LRVPATRINEIVNQRRGITADTAVRLARYFGTTSRFWVNLQSAYDLDLAEDRFREAVEREILPRSALPFFVSPAHNAHADFSACPMSLQASS